MQIGALLADGSVGSVFGSSDCKLLSSVPLVAVCAKQAEIRKIVKHVVLIDIITPVGARFILVLSNIDVV